MVTNINKFLLKLLFVLFLSLLASVPFSGSRYLSSLMMYAVLAAFCLVYIRKNTIDIQISPKIESSNLILCLLLTILAFPIANALFSFGKMLFHTSKELSVGSGNILIELIVLALIPAIVEETLFRGILCNMLSGLDSKFAILIPSLIFALFHFYIPSVLYAFLYGCIFSIVYLCTKNLIYNILMHLMFNSLNVFMSHFNIPGYSIFIMVIITIFSFLLFIVLLYSFISDNRSAFERKAQSRIFTKEGYIALSIFVCIGLAVTYM